MYEKYVFSYAKVSSREFDIIHMELQLSGSSAIHGQMLPGSRIIEIDEINANFRSGWIM